MLASILRFIRNGEGTTAVEYGVIAAFVVLAIVIALAATGASVLGMFDTAVAAFG